MKREEFENNASQRRDLAHKMSKQGKSVADIAKALETTPAAVNSLLYRYNKTHEKKSKSERLEIVKQEALQLKQAGKTTKEIAKILKISVSSAQKYTAQTTKENRENLKMLAKKLHNEGKNISAIAREVGKSRATILNYLNEKN